MDCHFEAWRLTVTKDDVDVSGDCYCGTQGIVVHKVGNQHVAIGHWHPNTCTRCFGYGHYGYHIEAVREPAFREEGLPLKTPQIRNGNPTENTP